jgi:glutaryl-CoA dehydrogenase
MTRNGEEPAALPGHFYGYADLMEAADRDLLDTVRGFLAEHVAPIALHQWERAEFPHRLVPEIAKLDIARLGIDFPDRPARSKLCTSFISTEFARADASMATFFGVHTGLAMGTIDQCGSEEQRERWLPSMRRMEAIGSFGLTEPDHGSDVAGGVHTTARRDGGTWVLNGAKR